MNQSNPSQNLSSDHTPLSKIIFQTLAKSNPPRMRFDHFMGKALYDSQHGYYTSSIDRKIGRGGDFYTSVSVGDTFGWILGFAIEAQWTSSQPLTLVEQGCHNAQLAMDIVNGLKCRNSSLLSGLTYYLYEPDAVKLADLSAITESEPHIIPVASLDQITEPSGIFLCNELLDAFPVRRFCRRKNEWLELFVVSGTSENELKESWQSAVVDEGFQRFLGLVEPYFQEWPDNYQTEFCEPLDQWLLEVTELFPRNGQWLIFDYGMDADRYFESGRRTGTLKCYIDHKTHDLATWLPGRCDISAHVNYSHLRCAAEQHQLAVKIEDQGLFLTMAAKDWLLSMEGKTADRRDNSRLQQFQTLTHPSMMGRSFQVVQLRRNAN